MSTTGSIEDKPRPSSTGRGMSGAAMSALRKARSLAAVSAGFGSPSRSKSSSAAFTVPDDNKSDNSDPPTHLAATSPTPIGPSSAATQHLLSSASSRSSGSSASSVSTTPSTAPTMVRSATLSANSRAAASAASAANVPSITTAPSSSSSIPQRAQVPSRSRATSASSSGSTADASSTTSAPPHTSGPLVPTPPKSPQRTPPAFSPTATSFTTEVDSSAGIFGLAAALQSESNDSFYAPGSSSSNKLTKRPVTAARSLRESDSTTLTSSVTNSSTTTGSIITSHGPLNPNSLVGKIAAKNAAAKAAAANGTTTPITKDKKKSIETGSVNKKESPGSKSIPDEEKISSTTSTTIPTPSTFYRVIRILAIITCIILIILSPIFYLIYTRFGFGKDFPIPSYLDDDVKGVLSTPTPESFLEIVGSLPLPPGNIAVSSRYRVFFTFHPEYNPPINVAELTSKTTFKAYPPPPIAPPAKSGIAANTPPPALPHPPLQSVLSLRIDKQDRLWLLDFAHHGLRADTLPPQLVCYKLGKWKDEFVMNYTFPLNIAGFGSMLNDFQVDPTGEYLYIVDTSIISMNPSIIVFSVKSKRSWRLLENHSSMFGSSYFVNVRGTPGYHVGFGPLGLKVNIDSVALDRSGSTLYYGAVTSDRLYSIATSQVLHLVERMERENGSRPEDLEALGYQVRLVSSDKPMTDGLSTDGNGNIWMTSIEHSAIVLATPMTIHAQSPSGPSFGISSSTGVGGGAGVLTDMQAMVYTKVIESKSLLRWPDGLSFGPDGLYITNSALHLKYSNFQGNITQYAPFHILKIVTKHLKNKLLYKKKGFSLPSPGQ